jgi:hypothetical protein
MAEADILELAIVGTLRGQQVVTTHCFVQKSVTSGFLGLDLVNEWSTGAKAAYLGAVSNDLTISLLRASDIKPGTAMRYELPLASANQGLELANALPNQVSATITWQTNLKGRSYRGRTFMPAVPSDWAGESVLTATAVTDYTAYANTMMTLFGPTGSSTNFQLAVVSRYLNKVERPQPVATVVRSFVLRTVFSTQRRRKPGVGA